MKKDSNFYLKGYSLTIENSKSLHKISKIAAENNEFGIACSLNILSAEEAVKSIFLILKYLTPDQEYIDFDDIFRKHQTKHNYLKLFLKSYDNHMNSIKQMIEPIENLESSFHEIKKNNKLKDSTVNSMSELVELKNSIKNYLDKDTKIDKIISWIEKANNDKNNGFYVNQSKQNEWQTPKFFLKEKFITENEYVKNVISFALDFEKMSTRVKHLLNKELNLSR